MGSSLRYGGVWYDTETGVVSYREPLSSGYLLSYHYSTSTWPATYLQLYTLMRIDYHVTRLWYTMQPRSISSSGTPRSFCGVDHRKRLRVLTMRIIYIIYSDFDHLNSLHSTICRLTLGLKSLEMDFSCT